MTNDDSLKKTEKILLRNELFDRIVNSVDSRYVALRKDFLDDFKKKLFCGQIGIIEDVILGEKTNKYCSVVFPNYANNERPFYQCLIEKHYLLPLFEFDPQTYRETETIAGQNEKILEKKGLRNLTLDEIRHEWETAEFDVIQNTGLKKHNQYKNRFKRGRLVTIQFDFTQGTDDGRTFNIQAGQIGIISNEKRNNFVEVTFWTIPVGLLALERKNFVSWTQNDKQNDNPVNYAINLWKRKIVIHQDFLFPLYCEELEERM